MDPPCCAPRLPCCSGHDNLVTLRLRASTRCHICRRRRRRRREDRRPGQLLRGGRRRHRAAELRDADAVVPRPRGRHLSGRALVRARRLTPQSARRCAALCRRLVHQHIRQAELITTLLLPRLSRGGRQRARQWTFGPWAACWRRWRCSGRCSLRTRPPSCCVRCGFRNVQLWGQDSTRTAISWLFTSWHPAACCTKYVCRDSPRQDGGILLLSPQTLETSKISVWCLPRWP